MKLKRFLYSKVHHNLSKVAACILVKIFTNYAPDRTLVFSIYKELKQWNIKKTHNQIKRWSIELSREFSKNESQMVKKYF